jgi:hypothetical protein
LWKCLQASTLVSCNFISPLMYYVGSSNVYKKKDPTSPILSQMNQRKWVSCRPRAAPFRVLTSGSSCQNSESQNKRREGLLRQSPHLGCLPPPVSLQFCILQLSHSLSHVGSRIHCDRKQEAFVVVLCFSSHQKSPGFLFFLVHTSTSHAS